MIISVYFSLAGNPQAGLSPKIKILDLATNAVVVNNSNMAEVGNGFYKYDFVGYVPENEYAIIADGGVSLSGSDRYVTGGNDNYIADINASTKLQSIDTSVKFIESIEGGKWNIVGSQLIMYMSDNITEVARFNLLNQSGGLTIDPASVFGRERI